MSALQSPSQASGEPEVADQLSRPNLSMEKVPALLKRLYGLTVTHVRQMNGYDDLNFHVQVERTHSNSYIDHVQEQGYTFKLMNAVDSRRPNVVRAHNQLMRRLHKAGFSVPFPVPNVDGEDWSVENLQSVTEPSATSDHVVRLLVFIPGALLESVVFTPVLLQELGELTANITNSLQDFDHPGYDGHESIWFLQNLSRMCERAWVVKDSDDRQLVNEVLQEFQTRVLPVLRSLPQGVVHGDLNEQNVLVSAECTVDGTVTQHVCGVLDVADSHRSAVVVDLAILVTYMMIFCDTSVMDRLDVGGHLLAGYLRRRQLSPQEHGVLKVCIAARLVQSLVGGAHAHYQNPHNQYVLSSASKGWPTLRRIWAEPEGALYDRWRQVYRPAE